jgi:hypothetical protein
MTESNVEIPNGVASEEGFSVGTLGESFLL